MNLQALPEGCIAKVVSLTTPRDACTLSLLSRSFRSAAESDAVWDQFFRFLGHHPPEINKILSSSAQSKKELYLTLCDNPVLIEQGKLSFSLDKWSGKKCYMLSARALRIVWAVDTPDYWSWISVPESRFEEVAELLRVCWLEIRGKIETRMLSQSTLYKVYLVFKSTAEADGFQIRPVEVTVGMVGGEDPPIRQNVFLDPERGQTQERDDGWLEIELGEFFCRGEEEGELEMTCLEIQGGHWKSGLIVQGIEVRPQRTSSTTSTSSSRR